jgi:hypothetical protein
MSTQASPLSYSPRNDMPNVVVPQPDSTPQPEHQAFRPLESELPSANVSFLFSDHSEHTEANSTPSVSALSTKRISTAIREHQTISSATTDRYNTSSWIFEILAVTVGVISVVATTVVLYHGNDRPLAAWTFVLTLNTVIATLGTLARNLLAFAISACIGQQKWTWLHLKADQLVAFKRLDEASHGPWGGFRLLVWLRTRYQPHQNY